MTKLHYVNKRTYKPGSGRESSDLPSQTVPDEVYSLKELVERAQRGIEMDRKPVLYFDEEDLEKVNRYFSPGSLDLTDLDALRDRVSEMDEALQKAIQRREEEKEQGELNDGVPKYNPDINSDEPEKEEE